MCIGLRFSNCGWSSELVFNFVLLHRFVGNERYVMIARSVLYVCPIFSCHMTGQGGKDSSKMAEGTADNSCELGKLKTGGKTRPRSLYTRTKRALFTRARRMTRAPFFTPGHFLRILNSLLISKLVIQIKMIFSKQKCINLGLGYRLLDKINEVLLKL